MTTKFTPGPWVARGSTPSRVYGMQRPNKKVIVAATGSILDNSGENARLISCAPEMYEMLESIKLDINKRITVLGNSYSEDEMLNRLKGDIDKLLAKARGEQ